MYEENVTAVVVPAYNEEGQVGSVIETIPDYVDYVYVVDDASNDGTWTEINRVASRVNDGEPIRHSMPRRRAEPRSAVANGGELPQHGTAGTAYDSTTTAVEDGTERTSVVPIRHENNRGVGGAIKTGYRFALEDDVDVTAVMAGDGQMDPDHLELLLEPVADGPADYAKGNRLHSPQMRSEMPTIRLFGNIVLSALTKTASGYWHISDSQNGYTVISKRALETIDLGEMYEFYGYCNDLLVKLNVNEMVVADVAIPSVYDDETSHISYRSYVPLISSMLLRNFLWRLKEKYVVRTFHPLVLLYAVGSVGVVVSMIQSLVRRLNDEGERSSDGPSLPTGITSVQCLVLAMLSDRRENADQQERIFADDRETN